MLMGVCLSVAFVLAVSVLYVLTVSCYNRTTAYGEPFRFDLYGCKETQYVTNRK
jgi:hypothetical protein